MAKWERELLERETSERAGDILLLADLHLITLSDGDESLERFERKP